MVIQLLVLGFALQNPATSMDELIGRFNSKFVQVRESAATRILERWKEWAEADLDKLEKLLQSKDVYVAARADSMLTVLKAFRRLPQRFWPAMPAFGPDFALAEAAEMGRFLEALRSARKDGRVQGQAIMPFLMVLIEDDRDVRIARVSSRPVMEKDYYRHPRIIRDDSRTLIEMDYTLSILARELIGNIVPGLAKYKTAELRSWWRDHQDKPEVAWNLSFLTCEDERLRLSTILRLLRFKDPRVHPIHPRIVEALQTLTDPEVVSEALRKIRPEYLAPVFDDFLYHRRLSVRLATARTMKYWEVGEAAEAIVEAFKHPSRMEVPPDPSEEWSEIYSWLLRSGTEKGRAIVVRECVSAPPQRALWAHGALLGSAAPWPEGR